MLHRRASAWHRAYGDPSEAIHHATAAEDVADASELILRVVRMLDLAQALLADNAEHVAACCRIEERA